MKEAIIGFVGVIVGSIISWVQSWYSTKREHDKNAHYLAIRVVITLRQYLYKCWLVSVDDGLIQGQRNQDGCLVPQASDPGPIEYPVDIDWKSVDPKIAYRLLSLQPSAESADRAISAAIEFSDGPPDYEDVFEERYLQYSKIGLIVIGLENEICKKYNVPIDNSEDWNPKEGFEKTLNQVESNRIREAAASKKLFDELSSSESLKEEK